jgi:hypothetical protein
MTHNSEITTSFRANDPNSDKGAFISDPVARLRHERRVSAVLALYCLDPMDAATICTEVLESMETDGPRHDPFGHVRSDARFWADCAPPHEVAAYTVAGLERLQNSPLGRRTRKRVFFALWQTFKISDRFAFLTKVDLQGNIRGAK